MTRPVNPAVPEDGYKSKKQFEDTGAISDADFSVTGVNDASKTIVFNASALATSGTATIKPEAAGVIDVPTSIANKSLSNLTTTDINVPLEAAAVLYLESPVIDLNEGSLQVREDLSPNFWATPIKSVVVDSASYSLPRASSGVGFGSSDVTATDVQTVHVALQSGSLITDSSTAATGDVYITSGDLAPSDDTCSGITGDVVIRTGSNAETATDVGGIALQTGGSYPTVVDNEIRLQSGAISLNTTSGELRLSGATISINSISGGIACNTGKLTGVGDPTDAQDAATKNYVDSARASVRAFSSSSSLSGTLATVVYATEDYDTNSAYNNATGNFTPPTNGKYQINASIRVSGTIGLNDTLIIEIQKNSAVISRKTAYLAAAITDASVEVSDILNLITSDLIRIQVSTTMTTPAIVSSNFDNVLSIARVH